jgi:hypothetical protein
MTTENNIYLKPCPFCGDSGFSVLKEGSIYVIQCGSCLCKTGATTEKEVIEYWNGRPIEEALTAENNRLREALENIKEKAVLKESEASNATYGFAYEIEDIARSVLNDK